MAKFCTDSRASTTLTSAQYPAGTSVFRDMILTAFLLMMGIVSATKSIASLSRVGVSDQDACCFSWKEL
eukprot:10278375-Heterocapsa_arctica.AAC.1